MDTSPTALFDSYEQDFIQFIETIRERLETATSDDIKSGKSPWPHEVVNAPDTPTFLEQKQSTLSRVERELDEADEMASK